jgi:DNA invertase Pin-like site-specific DNA recombinase
MIVATYADEGVSGAKDLDERLGLADALSAVKPGRAEGVVVYRLDRLARDLVLQEQLLAEVHRAGGQVFSTSAAEQHYLVDDPDDPSRRLIRQVLGAVNEYERSMISLRLRSGRRRKAELGGFAYGSPRFGTKTVGRELIDDESEQVVLARMRELRDGGASLRGIATILTEEGATPRRSDRWHPTTVQRALEKRAVNSRGRVRPGAAARSER